MIEVGSEHESSASSYEEQEVHYKITERVTQLGDVITERVEVVN